ncbi:DNA-directed RNA polymerase I, II, and III subunit RPABC1 [Cryptococcus gattii Ru294]|uniref:DNA-directed RNA polymerases I, II, and III subunit RPABC1 n=1 Tax=Cryptococcus gattii EJB2 TaxID=1296103 RepID=A0ABR5BUV0_9TREE|nr:DNA-directed RNA polymerase I, II, and III subunit RPABC1 [Cryptococcus gattii Ru294]KIR79424.1 DNA-directed RNA polymerase I, II, and III subunit RPABC1 [Cryptococcus gattii EJB2]KIY37370.1 DNA-directed RNA polymerase I, II, and III subunit RPABC1 [Cryptococcus gattii E566]KJE02656.1 DNA-directed RNA polymerase I, II, and III subunit RPABC1 [Cryptococcus gattii NT-10]
MSQEANRELARLWRVSRTVHEMVRDRGYLLADYEINVSFEEFKDRHGATGSVDFIGSMDKMGARRGIIIWSEKMSPAAKKTLQEMQSEYHLEDFPESDLLVNITKHFLVPKHTIMKPEEKSALIKRYRLKETQLPRIMVTDPVAKYYGLKRGQVMKIERASETAGRYITYRICM